MYMQSSPCGIGGPQDPGGPCTGTIGPKDAGGHVFDGVSITGVTGATIAAGLLLAGVLFAVFVARFVGRFFSGADSDDAEFSDDSVFDHGGGPTAEWRFDDGDEQAADNLRDTYSQRDVSVQPHDETGLPLENDVEPLRLEYSGAD